MKQLLFYDLDGTLSGKSYAITEKNQWALANAKEKGHKVFLCTGRPPISIYGDVEKISFDGMICCAGSYVFIHDQLIFENVIEKDLLKQVLHLFHQHDISYCLETKEGLYETSRIHRFYIKNYYKKVKINRNLFRFLKARKKKEKHYRIEDFDINKISVAKIEFITKNQNDYLACLPFLEKYFHVVLFSQENDSYVNGEIIMRDCTKREGILKVIDYFHEDINHTVGFGDSMNDYQMLETVHTGIVYENADKRLKELAQYTFQEPDQDGIYHIMRELDLCDEYKGVKR